jgi:hypothetical protein
MGGKTSNNGSLLTSAVSQARATDLYRFGREESWQSGSSAQ